GAGADRARDRPVAPDRGRLHLAGREAGAGGPFLGRGQDPDGGGCRDIRGGRRRTTGRGRRVGGGRPRGGAPRGPRGTPRLASAPGTAHHVWRRLPVGVLAGHGLFVVGAPALHRGRGRPQRGGGAAPARPGRRTRSAPARPLGRRAAARGGAGEVREGGPGV